MWTNIIHTTMHLYCVEISVVWTLWTRQWFFFFFFFKHTNVIRTDYLSQLSTIMWKYAPHGMCCTFVLWHNKLLLGDGASICKEVLEVLTFSIHFRICILSMGVGGTNIKKLTLVFLIDYSYCSDIWLFLCYFRCVQVVFDKSTARGSHLFFLLCIMLNTESFKI